MLQFSFESLLQDSTMAQSHGMAPADCPNKSILSQTAASSRESPSPWQGAKAELAQQEWSELLGALLCSSRSCWTHVVP